MASSVTATCLLLVTGFVTLPSRLPAEFLNPVAVASTISVEYSQQKSIPGSVKPETYLFFQGKFYGGSTRDSNLEHAQFDEIARILGKNMVHQNYYPSKDPKDADLLIAVHWGTTTVYESPSRQDDIAHLNAVLAKYNAAIAAGKHPDPGPVNMAQMAADAERAEVRRLINVNAELLGFRQQLAKAQHGPATSGTDEADLLTALGEERYFVILMAYDYHTMTKGSTPRLLWSTRFSIRAAGLSFTKALPIMGKVAANYFGQAIDGLKVETPSAREGKVEIGTPSVVDPEKK